MQSITPMDAQDLFRIETELTVLLWTVEGNLRRYADQESGEPVAVQGMSLEMN